MPRVSKSNARQMIASSLKNFTKVSRESVGLVFTWKGSLCVMGTDSYKSFVNENKEAVWRNLCCKQDTEFSQQAHDIEFIDMLENDISKYNVSTLRRLTSWVTQKSIGE